MKVIANTAINISWLSLNWLLLSSHLHFAISDSGMITSANSGVFFWYPGGNKPPISHHSGLLEYRPPQPIPSIPSVGSSSFSHIFFLWQLPISAMTWFFFSNHFRDSHFHYPFIGESRKMMMVQVQSPGKNSSEPGDSSSFWGSG